MSFKHLTANGSVDRGQPARAGGGRGRAHLVPADPSEGQGARLPVPPRPAAPGGPGPGSQVRGALAAGRGGDGGDRGAPGGWGASAAGPSARPGTGAEPWRRPAPRGPEGTPLSALCARVPWRAAGPAAALSDLGLFHEDAARGVLHPGSGRPAGCCEPGPGAGPGRWPGRASGLPGAARPGRPPLPPTAAALPARRGGGGGRRKEFLSQITSRGALPRDSCGGRGGPAGDFRECRGPGPGPPCRRRRSLPPPPGPAPTPAASVPTRDAPVRILGVEAGRPGGVGAGSGRGVAVSSPRSRRHRRRPGGARTRATRGLRSACGPEDGSPAAMLMRGWRCEVERCRGRRGSCPTAAPRPLLPQARAHGSPGTQGSGARPGCAPAGSLEPPRPPDLGLRSLTLHESLAPGPRTGSGGGEGADGAQDGSCPSSEAACGGGLQSRAAAASSARPPPWR